MIEILLETVVGLGAILTQTLEAGVLLLIFAIIVIDAIVGLR